MEADPITSVPPSQPAGASVSASPMRGRIFRFNFFPLLTAIALVAVLLVVGVPIYRLIQRDAELRQCESRLRQIALALIRYEDAYGQFPSVYIPDKAGQPAHSWRVLLLPFLDSTAATALAKYKFTEPWNGPNNSKLRKSDPYFASCPRFLRCPGDRTPKAMTSYVAIAGPRTMWSPSLFVRSADVLDGLSQTIMVVEIAKSDIEWLEPRDLPLAELHESLHSNSQPALLASHEKGGIQGGIVVFGDGHTEFLPHSISEQKLIEMLRTGDTLKH
jgi:type II secretory pathway pseudopilin PulG